MLLDDILFYDGDRCIVEYDIHRLMRFSMGLAEEKFFAYHVDECRKCRQFVSDLVEQQGNAEKAPVPRLHHQPQHDFIFSVMLALSTS